VPEGASPREASRTCGPRQSAVPLTMLGVQQALPRTKDMSEEDGLFVESSMAAPAQSGAETQARLADFVAKRGAMVIRPSQTEESIHGRREKEQRRDTCQCVRHQN